MAQKKFQIGDYEFIFKYWGNEAIPENKVINCKILNIKQEKTKIDGYRALIVGSNKNGFNYEFLFGLSGTFYDPRSEIIKKKYSSLENCFYKITKKYLEEKMFENSLISGKVNIMNYLK